MDKETLKQIINRDVTGYKISERSYQNDEGNELVDSSPAQNQVESSTPDFIALRQKYLHQDDTNESVASDSEQFPSDSIDNPDHDELIAVDPETAMNPTDRIALSKTVVVSGSEKKVIGEQG